MHGFNTEICFQDLEKIKMTATDRLHKFLWAQKNQTYGGRDVLLGFKPLEC